MLMKHAFERDGKRSRPLFLLDRDCTTKIFLLGLLFAVVLCFIRGKQPTQVADEIASLFIGHDHQMQHVFTGQGDGVLRFFWCSSILCVNVGEIPSTCSKKPLPKRGIDILCLSASILSQ